MKRSALVCVSLVAAACVLAVPSQAETAYRKPNFFEKLFGIKPKKRRVVEQDVWWEDNSDVRVVREKKNTKKRKAKVALAAPKTVAKKKPAVVQTAFVDPEVSEGLGMGNLVYTLPAQVAVSDKAIGRYAVTDTATQPIRLVLTDRDSIIKSSPAVRDAVLGLYKSAGFAALWVKDGRLSERGHQLLGHLAKAGDEGLTADRYLPAVLSDFANADQQIAGSTLAAAQLDVGLTVAAVTFAQHVSGGAFEPERLSKYHDVKPEAAKPDVVLKVLAHSPFPVAYLQSLAPQHPAYLALKAELAKIDVDTPVVSSFPAGPRVKVGQTDPRILQLREILAAEGLLAAAVLTDENRNKLERLDKALSKTLAKYQKSRGIKPTGQLDDATVNVLGGVPVADNRKLIAINMERLRWLPKELGQRHVLVNQASYTVDVVESGKIVWESNVIVGKPLNQTAVFSDTMETIVFNPSWGVPQSIILKEYLPKLRKDPGYLDKKGFQVVNGKGKLVKSRAVNWHAVGSNNTVGVMQPPGSENALGEVKFLFPNSHAIYMHDTPNRDLFDKSVRNFSHGCVRVQNPRQFAEVLLRWDDARVDKAIDSGKSSTVRLDEKVRVHLAYFTAWPGENGQISYFGDAYERDKTLLAAMEVEKTAFSKRRKQQLVEN